MTDIIDLRLGITDEIANLSNLPACSVFDWNARKEVNMQVSWSTYSKIRTQITNPIMVDLNGS